MATIYTFYVKDLPLLGVDGDGVEAYAEAYAEAHGGVIIDEGWKKDEFGDYYLVITNKKTKEK